MKDEIIICDCSSAEHQMALRFDDDKDLGRMVYVEIHLVPLVWYKRLWHGIKYIFGYKCCYGNFEEMILSPKHARQIYNLYKFFRPAVSPTEIGKIEGRCDMKAVEIGVTEKGNDNEKSANSVSITEGRTDVTDGTLPEGAIIMQ